METILELQKTIADKEQSFSSDAEFRRLRDFYEEMKRQGFVKKQEYSLPPLDTTGQGLYQAQREAFKNPTE